MERGMDRGMVVGVLGMAMAMATDTCQGPGVMVSALTGTLAVRCFGNYSCVGIVLDCANAFICAVDCTSHPKACVNVTMICNEYKNGVFIPRLLLGCFKKLSKRVVGITNRLVNIDRSFWKLFFIFFGHFIRFMGGNRK